MSAGHWTQDIEDIHIYVMEEETVKQMVASVIVGSYCVQEKINEAITGELFSYMTCTNAYRYYTHIKKKIKFKYKALTFKNKCLVIFIHAKPVMISKHMRLLLF